MPLLPYLLLVRDKELLLVLLLLLVLQVRGVVLLGELRLAGRVRRLLGAHRMRGKWLLYVLLLGLQALGRVLTPLRGALLRLLLAQLRTLRLLRLLSEGGLRLGRGLDMRDLGPCPGSDLSGDGRVGREKSERGLH